MNKEGRDEQLRFCPLPTFRLTLKVGRGQSPRYFMFLNPVHSIV